MNKQQPEAQPSSQHMKVQPLVCLPTTKEFKIKICQSIFVVVLLRKRTGTHTHTHTHTHTWNTTTGYGFRQTGLWKYSWSKHRKKKSKRVVMKYCCAVAWNEIPSGKLRCLVAFHCPKNQQRQSRQSRQSVSQTNAKKVESESIQCHYLLFTQLDWVSRAIQ